MRIYIFFYRPSPFAALAIIARRKSLFFLDVNRFCLFDSSHLCSANHLHTLFRPVSRCLHMAHLPPVCRVSIKCSSPPYLNICLINLKRLLRLLSTSVLFYFVKLRCCLRILTILMRDVISIASLSSVIRLSTDI